MRMGRRGMPSKTNGMESVGHLIQFGEFGNEGDQGKAKHYPAGTFTAATIQGFNGTDIWLSDCDSIHGTN